MENIQKAQRALSVPRTIAILLALILIGLSFVPIINLSAEARELLDSSVGTAVMQQSDFDTKVLKNMSLFNIAMTYFKHGVEIFNNANDGKLFAGLLFSPAAFAILYLFWTLCKLPIMMMLNTLPMAFMYNRVFAWLEQNTLMSYSNECTWGLLYYAGLPICAMLFILSIWMIVCKSKLKRAIKADRMKERCI